MNSINDILCSLNNLIYNNVHNPEHSDLLLVLDKYTREEILKKVQCIENLNCININELQNIEIKADAINSIILLLLEKSKVKSLYEKLDKNYKTETLLTKLHSISFDLYNNYNFLLSKNDEKLNLEYFVLAILNGILSDRVCEIDSYINENISLLIQDDCNDLICIKNKIYYLILFLSKRFTNLESITLFDDLIKDCNDLLLKIQREELKKESFNIANGFYINAIANILYVLGMVKQYLFEETSSNIYAQIDTYCFNAITLLNETNHSLLRQIVILLRYALTRLCRNSIWEIYGKSPLINQFIKSVISNGDSLIYSLLPSQRKALIEKKLLTPSKSIVITMPTSAGKTLIAELYILFTLHNYADKDTSPTVCYIVPTNALLNQTKRKLQQDFKNFNFKIETALPFYDVDEIESEILNQHIDILISTPEKLDFLIRSNQPCLKNLKLVILDEAHNIADSSRGSKFELLLSTIKQTRKNVNFLLLSPFIDNAKQIANWLGDNDEINISIDWSPTKQYLAYSSLHTKNGTPKSRAKIVYLPSVNNNLINNNLSIDLEKDLNQIKNELEHSSIDYSEKSIVLIERYLKLNGNILVYCNHQTKAQKLAQDCLRYFQLNKNKQINNISDNEEIKKAIALIKLNSSDNDPLIECLKYGIAYHHAKLSDQVKMAVENLMNSNLIKIMCASSTLAQGMNFPLNTIIFNTLKLGGGNSTIDIDGATFWNIAGRAGRAFKDSEGHIIITQQQNSNIKTEEILKQYIKHEANIVVSSLSKFFKEFNFDDNMNFDYLFLKDTSKNYAGISNFLQYLNHIIRIIYHYNFNDINTSTINNILSNSLVYKELEQETGFYKSYEKIRNFAQRYVNHIKTNKTTRVLQNADNLGISDISYSTFCGLVQGLQNDYAGREQELNITKQILEYKDENVLGDILQKIANIPELDIRFRNMGDARYDSIAKIIIGWVNGQSIKDIAHNINVGHEDINKMLGECNKYINQKLKSFIPWGAAIYQHVTNDQNTNDSKNLPSYLYYGVNTKEAVILSKLGVPRFAVNNIKNIIQDDLKQKISIDNLETLKQTILSLKPENYSFTGEDSKTVKSIVDESLI